MSGRRRARLPRKLGAMHRPDDPPPVHLEAHGFSAAIWPEAGATLSRLRWRGHELLLPAPPGVMPGTESPNRFGCWPLVPFANRAFGAVIDDGEQRVALPVNDPAMGAAIHGFGWQSAWQIAERTDTEVTLMHRRAGAGDPYSYASSLRIGLGEQGVSFTLSVTNEGDAVLPVGLGLHPWFPAAPDTRLTISALGALALGPGYIAKGLDPWHGGGPFAAGRTVLSAAELAHSIVGWRGEAVLETPSRGLALTLDASPNLRHPVLWTPPGAGFVCLEPQSHGIGAPSEEAARAVTPLKRLQPGESMAGWMEIRPRAL